MTLALEGITLSASATVFLKYHKGWVKISDTTHVDIVASGVDFTLTLQVDADKGKPRITTDDCSTVICNIDLHFTGGLSWLYELLREYLSKKLKFVLLSKLCDKSTELIDTKANQYIQALSFRTVVGQFAYMDYSFKKPLFKVSSFKAMSCNFLIP